MPPTDGGTQPLQQPDDPRELAPGVREALAAFDAAGIGVRAPIEERQPAKVDVTEGAEAVGDDGADLNESDDDDNDARPVIKLGPDTRPVVDDTVRALAAHPDVFQRGTMGLCEIIVAKEPPSSLSAREKERRPHAGDVVIEALSAPSLTVALSDVARFYARDKRVKKGPMRGWRRVQAPAPLVQQVLAQRTYRDDPAPRVLVGITEAPMMRPDGTVITAPGYDSASGIFLHWNGPPVEVPENPTHDDARAAYARTRKLFSSFSYQGDETTRETMIAATVCAVVTPLMRHALGDASAPGFMWSASEVASGKSTMAKACGAIVLGRIPAATQYTNDDDEMAKRAASYASTGAVLWFLDNVRACIEGSTLEQVLTCDGAFEARMLGTNNPRRMNWTATVYMTANGAGYSSDMARRVRHIALNKHTNDEKERVRALEHYNLVAYVLAHRTEILSDLLTIVRAHYIAGQPASGAPLDSFDEWCRWCAWPIWWASGYCPSRANPPAEASRDTTTARTIAVAWWDFIEHQRITIARLVKACADPDATRPGAEPRRADAAVELAGALADLAGVADLSRVNARSLGDRIATRIVGRSWEHPKGRVTIAKVGVTSGSASYAARLDAYADAHDPQPQQRTPLDADHPAFREDSDTLDN